MTVADDVESDVVGAQKHGLTVASKAAFGGGGRGMKVARTEAEIPELFESAVREAVAAGLKGTTGEFSSDYRTAFKN